MVYTTHIRSNTIIVIPVVGVKLNTEPIALVSKGVASEKVVAVAQTMANMAITSITFHQKLSTAFPSNRLQASENL